MCVTSPPYYGLRDYGEEGQIGIEPTPREYVGRLVEVFDEVYRVLADDGTLWLNIGDSYAGAQKNLAPAGVTIVIAKRDLIQDPLAICPTMLKWKVQDENKSLYNTPPCFPIYIATLVLRRLKKLGGVREMNAINEYKAGLLYDFIDNSSFYTNSVVKKYRSIMNVPFVTPSAELDAKFVKEAAQNGLVSLKGHRLVGGMRASIYNAMPVEGVQALIAFMKKFEKENA